jgi:hypothetical protein
MGLRGRPDAGARGASETGLNVTSHPRGSIAVQCVADGQATAMSATESMVLVVCRPGESGLNVMSRPWLRMAVHRVVVKSGGGERAGSATKCRVRTIRFAWKQESAFASADECGLRPLPEIVYTGRNATWLGATERCAARARRLRFAQCECS